jgi:ATP-dependent Lon protease
MPYNLRPRSRKNKKMIHQDDPKTPPPEDAFLEEEFEDSDEDPDYDPDQTSEEEADDEEEEDDSGDELEEGDLEVINFADLGRNYRLASSAPPIVFLCPSKRGLGENEEDEEEVEHEVLSSSVRKKHMTHLKKYSKEEKAYLNSLDINERDKLIEIDASVGNTISKDIVPLRFRILSSPMEDGVKRIVLNKLNQFSQMHPESGEYFKLKNWLENVSMLPFHKYVHIPVTKQDPSDKIIEFMKHTKQILDNTVYGHDDPKQQILRILAQWISNPTAHGHCIGIHGPMGIGKTSLIKEGLSKALGIPFGFIALGGASDGGFLEGHSYTYEGSTYGKIAEILIKTQCSNPIIFFDELDKVSMTKKGEEIFGILTHLTDMSQNEKFTDRYFGEMELNLSKCLIIFSYNDENLINPILRDRLITIKVAGYKKPQKLIIAKDYLLPSILKNYGFTPQDIQINDDMIGYIIENVPEEEGVRNLKRGLENIISWINMYRYMPNTEGKHMELPYKVTMEFIQSHLKKIEDISYHIKHSMYI